MKNLVTGFARQCTAGLVALAALTLLVGVVYPAAVWGVSRPNSDGAEGAPIRDAAGCVVGSENLGSVLLAPDDRRTAPDPYLHARYAGDPASSGPSNLGPNSEELVAIIESRRAEIAAREGVRPDQVPADAVTRSGSSLDPDISPAYAELQVPRIARVTGLGAARVREIIAANTAGRRLGFLGEPTVNVPRVNVALGLTAPDCR